ncbi:MAG: chemotaxis protein CheB [Pseudomonadota bacterium]
MRKKAKSPLLDIQQNKEGIRSSKDKDANIFPVVGIGASAGGLSAFTHLLKVLPTDTGMAFVLVQHLDPKHTSLLPELMMRATAMPVIEASDGMRIEPNHIYVTPPTHSLALLHGVLHLMQHPDNGSRYLPIDDFLKSLAQDRQSNAIGVILSGTASDGTLGLQAIKAAGGVTFAQSEDSAEYSGMPHNAIVAGHVDFVQTPEEIARKLALIARHPYLLKKEFLSIEERVLYKQEDLTKIFILLRARTGIDFTYYKPGTIQRRIKRRMVLHQIDTPKNYIKYLQVHPRELDTLFEDMLINVTSFFRDPETFEALKQEVFPAIMEACLNKQLLRIWVPACSTGEEVYSLAIALFEFLGDKINSMHIQIFASDIDKLAIDKARQGIYPQSIQETVGPERLQRFFIRTASGYQICRGIRDICVFAVQNVAQDPPYSRLNLICCRNLLIYLGTLLQKRVLHAFYYALQPNGFLMLGTSETIGSEVDLFSVIDKKNKIYIRKPGGVQSIVDLAHKTHSALLPTNDPRQIQTQPAIMVQHAIENIILKKYSPPGVIIDQKMQILHFLGQTGPYIDPSAGSATLNLLKMARQELVLELSKLIHQTIKENHSARKEGLRIHHDGNYKSINLQVIPIILNPKEFASSYLVLFEPGTEIPTQQNKLPVEADDKDNIQNSRIQALENDLLTEREYMQSIIEAQESTNEELQSANEEIQSTNEELQSANEELTTIIEEHENRNKELNVVNNDLTNLLASIDLPIVILYKDQYIRHFTPAAKLLLNLIDTDINRPINNIRANIDIPELGRQIQQVMETNITKSMEIQDHSGYWYNLRIHPYRTDNNYNEGVVMVFINIDSLKNAEQLRKALQYERRLSAVVRDSNDSVTVQDFEGHILAWNQRATEMYGYSEDEALHLDANMLIPEEIREDIRTLFKQLQHGEKTNPCETIRRAKDGHVFKVWMTTSALCDEAGNATAIAITEREII